MSFVRAGVNMRILVVDCLADWERCQSRQAF